MVNLVNKDKIRVALFGLLIIIIFGTLGYHLIEGWNILESLYTTIQTISTVGYGDYTPQTGKGKLFTIILIIFGVGTMLYTVGMLAETMVEGRIGALTGKGKQG